MKHTHYPLPFDWADKAFLGERRKHPHRAAEGMLNSVALGIVLWCSVLYFLLWG